MGLSAVLPRRNGATTDGGVRMTKISAYITCLNSKFWFATLQQTILSALEFADEVVVADGASTDGTIELVELLASYDDRIKLYIYPDKYELGQASLADRKSFALSKTTGDWAVLMDSDEVIGEWDAPKIRELPEKHPEAWGFKFKTLHFYRDWYRVQEGADWYRGKIYMVNKSLKGLKHGKVGRDRDNFLVFGNVFLEQMAGKIVESDVKVFHYGWCRPDHVLLMKKWRQEISWWGAEYWKSHKFPFKFDNPKKLAPYLGKHPLWMREMVKEKWRWLHEFDSDYKGVFK